MIKARRRDLINSQPIHKTLKFIFIFFSSLFNIKDAIKSWLHENYKFLNGINWVQKGMVFQKINDPGS